MNLKLKIFFNFLFLWMILIGTGKSSFAQSLNIKEIEDTVVNTDYGNFAFQDLEIKKR